MYDCVSAFIMQLVILTVENRENIENNTGIAINDNIYVFCKFAELLMSAISLL